MLRNGIETNDQRFHYIRVHDFKKIEVRLMEVILKSPIDNDNTQQWNLRASFCHCELLFLMFADFFDTDPKNP